MLTGTMTAWLPQKDYVSKPAILSGRFFCLFFLANHQDFSAGCQLFEFSASLVFTFFDKIYHCNQGCVCHGVIFHFLVSEVLIDEKCVRVRGKKAKVADAKRLKSDTYIDVSYPDTDMYLPPTWHNIHSSAFIQSSIVHIFNKTAIDLSKIAVLFLTKTIFFRHSLCKKHSSTFIRFDKVDKPGIAAFSGCSSGCRSPPPLFWFFTKKLKRRFIYEKNQFAGALPVL